MARRLIEALVVVLGLACVAGPAKARPYQEPSGDLPPVEQIPLPDAIPDPDELPPVELPPAKERPIGEPREIQVDPGAPLDAQVEPAAGPQAVTPPPASAGVLPPFADRLGEGPQEVGLLVDVSGPEAVNLNVETKLTITLRNQGKDDAHEVVIRDALPANLQYIEAIPKPDQQDGGTLVWRLGTVPATLEKTIEIRVKAISAGSIDHVPRVDFSTGAKARMTILKPELKVEITASRNEIQRGESVDFNVTVTNIGNGTARSVVLQAVIDKGLEHEGDATTFSQDMGDIGPNKTIGPILFSVAGTQLGPQKCEVSALSGDVVPAGQPGSTASATVNVTAPLLTVEVAGPTDWLKGSVATYVIKVTNKGTAAAEDVAVAAFPPYSGVPKIPADATSSRDDQKSLYRIYWKKIPRIEPNQTVEYQLPIRLEKIQNYVLNVAVNAKGVGADRLPPVRSQITTEVAGVADVQIVEMGRTSAVIGINDETDVTIRLKNVGSQEAKEVKVSFEASDKLKLVATEGTVQAASVDPKRPNFGVFPPIDRMEPGMERTLRVKVAGLGGGNADFRVKVFWEGMPEEQAVEHKTFVRVAEGAGSGTTQR